MEQNNFFKIPVGHLRYCVDQHKIKFYPKNDGFHANFNIVEIDTKIFSLTRKFYIFFFISAYSGKREFILFLISDANTILWLVNIRIMQFNHLNLYLFEYCLTRIDSFFSLFHVKWVSQIVTSKNPLFFNKNDPSSLIGRKKKFFLAHFFRR